MEMNELTENRNISLRLLCQGSKLLTIFIGSIYLCMSISAMALNGLVLTGLAHLSYSSSSKRFLGIRRSFNKGHPHFRLKNLQHTRSVKVMRLHTSDEEGCNSFTTNETSMNTSGLEYQKDSSIHRSPSCPDRMFYLCGAQTRFTTKESNYWLNQLNVGRKRSVKQCPQPKARLTTALHLVYSLILADLLNAIMTSMNLLLDFWYPNYASSINPSDASQVKTAEPCTRLVLSAILYTSYNASLCSIAGLMMDLYLGVVRPMHYRVLPKSTLLRYICGSWAFALFLGCQQLILPAFQTRDTSAPIYRRFLLPSEPCDILHNPNRTNFCLIRGTANTFRSGFISGGFLFICIVMMNTLCILSLQKVRRDSLTRTRTMRAMDTHRSVSLPTINRVDGFGSPLHGLRTAHFMMARTTPRCTGRKLLRSSFTLLALTALFAVFFLPSLALDAYFVLTDKAPKLPPWIFDLVTHMPISVALLNPIVYSLRLNDIHAGLHNFKKRLLARSEKGFLLKRLRPHRELSLNNTKPTAHLQIRLPPKNTDVVRYDH
ncbi:hypothetical protein EGR_01682 [Echinococcus granulosus]|uniref:G-protein coupled receptors family 1 profile domain-containing protein n=1 Tax=Echinococcus granulosus TaxID=6210 RepID=W6UPP3_ECHGR|nr:hypothetical protein EGR_01682 [Echinococcus granulosus]EUB63600.1 hypothetical protein EGR_01682 [Echinococcus granulosus]